MNEELALSIKDLAYDYRSHWTYRVKGSIKPFSLDVKAGEAFGFLGHNGAGKTTTIKCLLNLVRPKSGEIEIFGVPSSSAEARRHIGYIPEQPYFYDNISVQETVTLYATLAGVPEATLRSSVDQAIELVGLSERRKSSIRSLSKGLMQRVALAQAIVNKPRLLILDEPFSGLDPIGRREFRNIFEKLNRAGATLFMSSHILSDVEALCQRASIMVKGELKKVVNISSITNGTESNAFHVLLKHTQPLPEQVVSIAKTVNKLQEASELILDSRGAAESVLQKALALNIEIVSFEMERPSLEKLFVEVISNAKAEVPNA